MIIGTPDMIQDLIKYGVDRAIQQDATFGAH